VTTKTIRRKVHLDTGNDPDAMSVLTVVGDFSGGDFCFPEYGIGIPIRPGDLLIARTNQEYHCNVGEVTGTRHSVIAYARFN
jgi:hypothetical protein